MSDNPTRPLSRSVGWTTINRESMALLLVAGGLSLAALGVWLAPGPTYAPGRPLFSQMPLVYVAGLLACVGAVLTSRRPGARLAAAGSAVLLVVLPLVVLLPFGHLHDSNRNLL